MAKIMILLQHHQWLNNPHEFDEGKIRGRQREEGEQLWYEVIVSYLSLPELKVVVEEGEEVEEEGEKEEEEVEEDGEKEEEKDNAGVWFPPWTTQIYDTIDSSCGVLDNNVSVRTALDMKKRHLLKLRRSLTLLFNDWMTPLANQCFSWPPQRLRAQPKLHGSIKSTDHFFHVQLTIHQFRLFTFDINHYIIQKLIYGQDWLST